MRFYTDGSFDVVQRLVTERDHIYEKCRIAVALMHQPDGWFLVAGSWFFCDERHKASADVTYNYGDVVLSEQCVGTHEALALAQQLRNGGKLELKGLDIVEFGEASSWDQQRLRLGSADEYGLSAIDWPADVVAFRPGPSRALDERRTLSGASVPLYPDVRSAVLHFVFRRPDLIALNATADHHRTEVVMPDYRARIGGVELSEERLDIKIERRGDDDPLQAKLYLRTGDVVVHEDAAVAGSALIFDIGKNPQHLLIQLLDKDGRHLDEREMNFLWGKLPRDFTLTKFEQEAVIRQMIDSGEGPKVEFKLEFNRASSSRILRTICAFANSDGGTILVGVDDEGRVCQAKFDVNGVRDDLTNMVADQCDGVPPDYDLGLVVLDGNPVMWIRVPEGRQKPYVLKNQGIFVRTNATTRRASRHHTDQMYPEQSSRRGRW